MPQDKLSESGKGGSAKGGRKSWLTTLGVAVVVLFAYGATRATVAELTKETVKQPAIQKSALISEIVKEVKRTEQFPKKLDEVTTLNDVVATQDAVRYEHSIAGADRGMISESTLRGQLQPTLCSNKDTRSLLNQEIAMEYLYKFANSNDEFLIRVELQNCQ